MKSRSPINRRRLLRIESLEPRVVLACGALGAMCADYNSDGAVNAADYQAWVETYGESSQAESPAADGDGDGRVSAIDYVLWRDSLDHAAATEGDVPLPVHDAASDNWARWLSNIRQDGRGSTRDHALAYAVLGDQSHRDKAIAKAQAIVTADNVAGNQYLRAGGQYAAVFSTLAWCDPPEAQANEWIEWGRRHLGETDGSVRESIWWSSRWSRNNPANNYYHSFVAATSYYAMATGDQEWLDWLREDRLPRMHAYYSTTPEGGSREGTGYGESHRRVFGIAKMWRDYDGTEVLPQEFINNSILYWTHATTPGHGWVALIGDHTRTHGRTDGYHRHIIGAALALADAPEAIAVGHWQLNQLAPNTNPIFFSTELRDFPDTGHPPTTLEYHAAGAGHFFARSSWADDATYVYFTAGEFDEAHQQQDQGAFAVFAGGRWQTSSDSPWTHGGIAQGTSHQNVIRFDEPQRRGRSGELTWEKNGDVLTVTMDLTEVAQNPWVRRVVWDPTIQQLNIRDWCDPTAEFGFCVPSEDDTREPYWSDATAETTVLEDGLSTVVSW